MTSEQINRIIAEYMGRCWHDWKAAHITPTGHAKTHCRKCGIGPYDDGCEFLDYDSDSSPRSLLNEVEAKVMAESENMQYDLWARLCDIVCPSGTEYWGLYVAFATAAQRAEAIVRAIGKWEDDDGNQ